MSNILLEQLQSQCLPVSSEVLGQNKAVVEKGYTKAVDMWSVGCVTTVVLTGVQPFSWASKDANQSTQSATSEAARNANLDGVEHFEEWKRLTGYPKDLVQKLLILDEDARMTADQALKHDWFVNDYFREEFRQVYEKAILGWRKCILPLQDLEHIAGYGKKTVVKGSSCNKSKLIKPVSQGDFSIESFEAAQAHRTALSTLP